MGHSAEINVNELLICLNRNLFIGVVFTATSKKLQLLALQTATAADEARSAESELAVIISYPTSASGVVVLLNTPPKYRKLK